MIRCTRIEDVLVKNTKFSALSDVRLILSSVLQMTLGQYFDCDRFPSFSTAIAPHTLVTTIDGSRMY